LKDLIRRLLVTDSKERLGSEKIQDIKDHPFFKEPVANSVVEDLKSTVNQILAMKEVRPELS